ncbi:MAG: PAS domain S-box protein [Melioribacteraceae bacterium]|nr:PAS domain S-box protein [Melioribacteraceae bacterium]
MLNKMFDNEMFSPKSFSSLREFKSLEELPNTKPLALVDIEGNIKFSNKSFENALKLTDGDNFSKLKSDPDLTSLVSELSHSKYSSFHTEFIVYDSDNKVYHEHYLDIERVLINLKEFFVVIFTSSKVFDRIENRLNNLHDALEYGNVPVIITDNEGIINYISKSFEEITGLNIENLYQNPITEAMKNFFSEDDIFVLEEAIKENKGFVKLISDLSENGEIWFKEVKLNPVQKSEDEEVSFILTAHDITSHILKNRIFRKSEQRQRSIINNISDLLLIIREEDNNYILENANDNFYNDFDIPKETAIENLINEFLPEELYDLFAESIQKFSENESCIRFSFSDRSLKREFLCKLTKTSDPYNNNKLYILSLADITEQLLSEEKLKKAFEKETQLNKLKTAFLANMSHEIRTPLNAIVGYSDLLEDEIEDGEKESLQELAGFLKDGVKRLLKLVDNIVEVSILESGEQTFDLEKFNINYLVHNFYEASYSIVSRNNLQYLIELEEKPSYINIDELKFRKIMDMLVDNSVKYNKSGGKVILRTETVGDFVSIEIHDTGIGIEDHKIKEILEPFAQQEEEGYRRNYEGAGLGLTIAFKLTEQLNGMLNIKSKANEWTSIYLTFPILKMQ